MAGAKVPLTFRIFKGDQLLREEKLSLSVIKLGKVPSAHLKLDDETVSRMHAIIEVNGPGDVSIIDLGSTKGTFVNGQKVNKAKLQSGDTLTFDINHEDAGIGIEFGPFENRATATVARHEMHLHSVQHAGSRTIEGDLIKPEGSTVDARDFAKHSSLINIRKDFIPEIIKSAEDL